MKELFLFVRPPRPLWPFNGPASAVWPPLAFASLAAALREQLGDLAVAILDAPALHMGWRSLEVELHRLRPAYVAIGEEAVSCREGLRLARMAKEMHAYVIAGGCFFSHVAEEALGTGLVDAVVHGEGEITIVELVEALRSGTRQDVRLVQGISFREGEAVVRTPPRPLIPDLDRLPMPAYDLLPVSRYGHGSRNHPDLAAIELGRGCFGSCNFCVLWRQMGRFNGVTVVPHLRTKSAERLIEEIRILTGKYQRRYLTWVDPCFNADPGIHDRLAGLMLKGNLRIGQAAWVRADTILRDAASGALGRCVRAGLNEVYIGIERSDPEMLHRLNKTVASDECRRALRVLARDYPEVYTVGSFIYGMPGDTPESIKELRRFASGLALDYAFFIPLTPLPGTPYWRKEMWDPTGETFQRFSFLPGPPIQTHSGALERALLASYLLGWDKARIRGWLRGMFHPEPRRRRLTRRLLLRGCSFEFRLLLGWLTGHPRANGMYIPRWYES
jgi:anaerobic magnesium-protoporphyrin IX monomethyl ester cyclase